MSAATGGLIGGCSDAGGSSDAKVTLTIAIIPDPTGASQFYRQQFDAFEKDNPGVKVNVLENPTDQNTNAISLMFQQGNAPDVYRVQSGVLLDQFLAKGWVADLNPHAGSDFASRFPSGAMNPAVSGVHRDGKLYAIPLVAGKAWGGNLLAYNKALLEKVGRKSAPTTWGEFEDTARAITAAGDNKVYGFAPVNPLLGDLAGLQATAGPSSIGVSGLNYLTGKAGTRDQSLVAAVDMFRRLNSDKIMTPGWASWDTTRSYTEFAKERLGMFVAYNFFINEIVTLNQDISMGIAPLPVPDGGRKGRPGVPQSFLPAWSMSSQTKYPEEAWKLVDFLASEKFQRAYFERFRSFTAVESAWREGVKLSEHERAMLETEDAQMRTAPNPPLNRPNSAGQLVPLLQGNQDLKWVPLAVSTVSDNKDFGQIAAGLDSKIDKFVDSSIASLVGKGVKAVHTDLVYDNWDPLKDWTP